MRERSATPREVWELMNRSLRQLSVDADADAEAVSGLAILLAHDFPSFAVRVLNVLVFVLETATGVRKALFVVMIINKLLLQGAVTLEPFDLYIRFGNRHLAFLVHGICYHDGVVLRTFHEYIKSWMMRGVYSLLLWQQVVELESTCARLAQPMS